MRFHKMLPTATEEGVYAISSGEIFELACHSSQCQWKGPVKRLAEKHDSYAIAMYVPDEITKCTF